MFYWFYDWFNEVVKNLKPFSELYTEKHFSDVKWENEKTPIPKEIWDYYANHQEKYQDIPLNAKTATEIANILDGNGGG